MHPSASMAALECVLYEEEEINSDLTRKGEIGAGQEKKQWAE